MRAYGMIIMLLSFLSAVFTLPIVHVRFNNSHNYSSNMLGGCLGTYFGCCGDNVTFCMNMNCTNCMNNTVY